MPCNKPLHQRLEALARQRTEEGYMAEVVVQADGTFYWLKSIARFVQWQ